ncbi:hypothetical protein ACT6QH_02025 [Xanthobacter sp. TB0139]|uniref:hypothetical protein n=1 Tax=Xanthobacter sp. TB0139 TaxID=3459178 RepID=UPI00403A789B
MKQRIDIEHLVAWAYRDQRVDRVAALARGVAAPRMRSATDAMMSIEALGTRVGTSGLHLTALGAAVAPDAMAVHEAVMALPGEALALVVGHGRGGCRPSWHGREAERLVADTYGHGGRVRMVRDLGRREVGCRLRWAVDPALVAHSRGQYVMWWYALDGLACGLAGALCAHEAAPPAAPREPWLLRALYRVDEPDWLAIEKAG